MKQHWSTWWRAYAIAVVMVCAALLVFKENGLYDTRVDGDIYAGQISSFSTGNVPSNDPAVMMRLFKPLYAIIGGSFLHTDDPYAVILVIDLFMYALLAASSYFFLREMDFDEDLSTLGVLMIVTAYPLLKYGLSLSTDISGWAFSAVTLAIGLKALRKDHYFLLCIASIVGFLGAISKETGALGLIALFLLMLWRQRKQGMIKAVFSGYSAALFFPAAILYGVLISALIGHGPTFLDWYLYNHQNVKGYNTLFRSIAVEASTFNILWALAAAGAIALFRKIVPFKQMDVIVALFISTSPILLWPMYISRITFIQFLWVIPLALIGCKWLQTKTAPASEAGGRLVLKRIALILAICDVGLFLLSAGGSLFRYF